RHVPVGFLERLANAVALGAVADSLESARGPRRLRKPDLQRERVDGDAFARRNNRDPLHDILELANIARPGVLLEQGDDAGIDLAAAEIVARREPGEKVSNQIADVLRALA